MHIHYIYIVLFIIAYKILNAMGMIYYEIVLYNPTIDNVVKILKNKTTYIL